VVRDEVWRQMRLGLRAVQAVDSDLRLSRAHQKIQILAMHTPSDPLSVGDAGSQEVAIAKDLLSLCSTDPVRQSTRVADQIAHDFALSEKEQDVITGWAMERPAAPCGRSIQARFESATILTRPRKPCSTPTPSCAPGPEARSPR